MAGLNITERRLPQDGRAHIVVGGRRNRPANRHHADDAWGERRLSPVAKRLEFRCFDRVGLAPRNDEILRSSLQAPFGMIIVTGPTGSGKTTTLAASLAVINEPKRKILTIEDPIEYHIFRH